MIKFHPHDHAKSRFSFADYRDPQRMGFRRLRVINEDRVIPGAGFPPTLTGIWRSFFVLEGTLEHQGSLGNGTQIRPSELQRMSAGTGVTHSEFNPSKTERAHFLHVWIIPEQRNLPPSYERKEFPIDERHGRLRLVAAPDVRDGALELHQDARLFLARLRSGEKVVHAVESPIKAIRAARRQAATGRNRPRRVAVNYAEESTPCQSAMRRPRCAGYY